MTAATPRHVPSLGRARTIRPAREAAWRRDVVWVLIDELNALFDPLQQKGVSPELMAKLRDVASVRMSAIQQAASWNPALFETEAKAFMQTELERPVDVFGPAVILLSLAPEGPATRDCMDHLPKAVGQTLRALGLLPVAKTNQESASVTDHR